MSHVVTIKLAIIDLDAFEEACKALGAELRRGQEHFNWYGRWMNDFHGENAAYKTVDPKTFGKCTHAVHHPKCQYEIGVVQNEDGSYRLLADEWGPGGLPQVFGENMQKLQQRYAAEVAKATMQAQGFHVEEVEDDETGYLKLVCTNN